MKLTFITRAQSVNKEILSIFCRITLRKQLCEIMLPIKVDSKWQKSRTILNYLEKVKEDLTQIYLRQLSEGYAPSATQIKQQYLNSKKKEMLLDLFTDYVENYLKPKAKSGEVQEDTITVMGYTVNHVKCFLQEKYKTANDIEATSVTKSFISDFEAYLRFHDNKSAKHNSVVKHLQRMKRVFKYAVNVRESFQKNPFDGYCLKRISTQATYLTAEELRRIINKKGLNERLAKVRDMFVFQCLTGLAYIDMKCLVEEDIDKTSQMIIKQRHKTKVEAIIPLPVQAICILEKYNYKLPVSTNQKMNAYLKEIATICNVNKTLSTHVARHTFATTVMLQNGVPLQIVSKMLGHSSVKMTEHYAKTSPELIRESGKANAENIDKFFDSTGDFT